MLSLFIRPFHLLGRAFLEADSPSQVACGFSLGMVAGLVPKGNLLALALIALLVVSRVNLAAGLLATFLFSWLGVLVDPFTHLLGRVMLTAESLQGFWTWVYQLPLAPWTDFHNTVVLGNFLLGLALFAPVYFLMRPLAARFGPDLRERLVRWKVVHFLGGAEWAASHDYSHA